MGRIPGARRAALAFAAALSLALVLGCAQTTNPPANSSSSATAPTAKPADQKSADSGGWRHFGESPSSPSAQPLSSGAWRDFGQDGGASPPTRENPNRRGSASGHGGAMERLMWQLIDRDRADLASTPETHGRALPLQWNDRLAAIARAHSLDMLNQGYFGHVDPAGRSVAGRVEAAGLPWQSVGENIAIYNSVARAEAAFMNEPRFSQNHRGNILNPEFTDVGVGIVQASDGRLYITQDFYTASSRPSATSAAR